jgi:hypothetical protein
MQPYVISRKLSNGGWERDSVSTSDYTLLCLDIKLEVPTDDTTLTMWDALARRVQWIQTTIDIDPAATASASTSPASMSPEACLPPSPNPKQLVLSPILEQLPPIIEKLHKSPI